MKINYKKRKYLQKGFILTFTAVILMAVVSILTFYTTNAAVNSQKISANSYRTAQAFQAADAGLEFGLAYLSANVSSIVRDNNNNGYIDSYTFPNNSIPSLSNGSRFTISYVNPINNNFSLIRISSTGYSADNGAVSSLRELVQSTSLIATDTWALVALGTVTLSGNASISIANGSSGNAIRSASTVDSSGNVTVTGGVTQNDSTLGDASTFFSKFFNASSDSVKAIAQNSGSYYNASGDYSSTLDNLNGKVIWIDGNVTIASNADLGTSSDPVILVVNGDLSIAGNADINGIVYVTPGHATNFSGSVNIVGGAIIGGDYAQSGNGSIVYNSSVIANLNTNGATSIFVKVPDSWRDF